MHRVALAAAVALLALPSVASAGVQIESVDTAIPTARALSSSVRTLPARQAPYRFNLVGIHWQGPGSLSVRTATKTGAWSEWRDARPEAEDAPDPGSREAAARRGWKLGNPLWTGAADRIQYRTAGRVSRIRAFFVASPVTEVAVPARSASVAQPAIILRRAWGANERIVRAEPYYADRIAFSVVHHTAGAQPSSPAQSAAIVRGIQTYHVKGNGWNDIGYNFLVDRFGQIFEGRGGGIAANVVGAHAQGFNTGSVGTAVLGTFTGSSISTKARRALVSVLAWRLDLAHVNPTSWLTWISGGNPKYPPGRKVRLRAVSGHRDTGPTSCPGSALYAQLPGIARSVRARGGTKIYAPWAIGRVGGLVRVRAVVDPAGPWTVRVTDSTGATVASGGGNGATVDWTWDATLVEPGTYRWTISAGDARVATGIVGAPAGPPPPLDLTAASVSPAAVSPNGDGVSDTATLAWETTAPAELRVIVLNGEGRFVARAYPWTHVPAGPGNATWNGATLVGDPIRDGVYTLRFKARTSSETVTRDVPVTIDRTLGAVTVSPEVFSPNGDQRVDEAEAGFTLARRAQVVVSVAPRDGGPAASVFEGTLPAGRQTVAWAGLLGGEAAADGLYTVAVRATTGLGTRRARKPVRVDTRRPVVSGLVAERTTNGTRVRFTLDEPGSTAVRLAGLVVRVEGVVGENRLWRRTHVRRVRVRSWDAAGNPSLLAYAWVR